MKIPVQNIYYMLLYAWDALEEADAAGIGDAGDTKLLDLFARVLVTEADRALRRGLDRGYAVRTEIVAGIRGKLELTPTMRAGHLWRGRTVCTFDELSYDIPHNRIVKATAGRLLRVRGLDAELREHLSGLRQRLAKVSDIELGERSFHAVQLHRNNRHYRLLMNVCRLIHRSTLPEESGEEATFRDFGRDERWMRRLFERFVRNFYRHEQREFRVEPNDLAWANLQAPPDAKRFMPRMRTDVRLLSRTRRIVIETKFVADLLQHHRGAATFRSGHLYQLMAYLNNLHDAELGPRPEGILLYPTVDRDWDVQFKLQSFDLRVCTVPLSAHWPRVRRALLGLLANS